jgi:hypothetical protein
MMTTTGKNNNSTPSRSFFFKKIYTDACIAMSKSIHEAYIQSIHTLSFLNIAFIHFCVHEHKASILCPPLQWCGIIAGFLRDGALHCSQILIPKQTGTRDTCTCLNEMDLFEYQAAHDLLTIGLSRIAAPANPCINYIRS